MNIRFRKAIRASGYDYNQSGSYFITICVQDRHEILSTIGDSSHCTMSSHGIVVENNIERINMSHPEYAVRHYVIMPNHIHLILEVHNEIHETTAPEHMRANMLVPKYVSLLKRLCNREYGYNIFQKSYYDHVIRTETDYNNCISYIKYNPSNWLEDEFKYQPRNPTTATAP